MKFILAFSLLAVTSFNQAKVYVCKSPTAYAYHNNKDCKGLNRCTHTIVQVTLKEAKDMSKEKACGYCYK